jgi:AcrR family transcriptional regulator
VDSRSKRQKILDGMLEAVGEVGYEGTSVRTVLARTELYRQAFYDNFTSKEDCYLQAYDVAIKRIEAGICAATAGEVSWRGQLRAGLGALLDFFDTEPDVGRALVVEVHPAGPPALAKRTEALARARGFLDQGRAAVGTNGDQPPRLAPEAIASGIHMVVHSRLATGEGDGFRALLPQLMYVAVLPYFGPEAAKQEMLPG